MSATISIDLLNAYLETDYQVSSQPGFVLNIDQCSEQLLNAYQRLDVKSAAFITAFNPFSKQLSPLENSDRHTKLVQEIESRKLAFVDGIGQHPSNNWPGEPSILVFGIDRTTAETLGRKFEQNAIVYCNDKAIPELVML